MLLLYLPLLLQGLSPTPVYLGSKGSGQLYFKLLGNLRAYIVFTAGKALYSNRCPFMYISVTPVGKIIATKIVMFPTELLELSKTTLVISQTSF